MRLSTLGNFPTPVTSSSFIQDPLLRYFYEYWDSKRGEKLAVAYKDINPVEIPDLLGHLNIYEVSPAPRDFRVRLNGTRVSEMLGQDVTGKWCSSVTSGEDGVRCKATFNICVDKRTPALTSTSLAFCGKPYGAQTLLAVPLSTDGEKVDMIASAHIYWLPETRFAAE